MEFLYHFKSSFKYDKLNFHFIYTLSKLVCGNMPGFLATFRSRNLLSLLIGVIAFAARGHVTQDDFQ